ncbi:hypothetical protein [Altererythrobacter lauratis]|uniref:Lipoprotein n=1 Tax=Alteraurantiacibacter lauratis TaxID=2054627 RepID=A0ABV7EKF2_9SPHN
MTNLSRSLVLGCSILALAACGPEEIASPGTGGNVIINNPPAAPAPTPTPTPTAALVTPATGCPTITATGGLTDEGTITGPTGTWRICALPLLIDEDSTLPYIPGLLYRLAGQTRIGTDVGSTSTAAPDVQLTIQPGVIVYASGSSYLAATRGNQLIAVGTRERPIIFTSRDNVLGLNGQDSSSQWGGVVMLGRAQVTDCFDPLATPGTTACEFRLEGSATPAFGGGIQNADNSGRLEYVQIRYSGFVLGNDNELQSLTTVGTGTGTQFRYIQTVNSSDDGVEFFGGRVNMKNLILYGAEDDSLDVDVGVKANLQYVIAVQRATLGDTILEGDSSNGLENSVPRTSLQLTNATLIQRWVGDQVLRVRGGMDFHLSNSVVIDQGSSPVPCLRIDDAATIQAANAGLDKVGPPIFASVAFQCATTTRNGSNGGANAATALGYITGGTGNNVSFTNSLTASYIGGANETGFTPIFNATTLSTFFDAVTFIGAVSPTDDWTQGWTCNMSGLSFGTGNTGSCLTLPVYN